MRRPPPPTSSRRSVLPNCLRARSPSQPPSAATCARSHLARSVGGRAGAPRLCARRVAWRRSRRAASAMERPRVGVHARNATHAPDGAAEPVGGGRRVTLSTPQVRVRSVASSLLTSTRSRSVSRPIRDRRSPPDRVRGQVRWQSTRSRRRRAARRATLDARRAGCRCPRARPPHACISWVHPRVRREARINAPETYRCTVHPRLCVHSRACRFAGPPASTATWSRRSRRFRPTPRLRLVPAVLGCSAARFRRSFARALRHTHRPVPARSHGLAALPAPAARPVLTGDLSLVAVDDLVCLLDAAHDASARPPLGDRPRPGQVVSIVPLAIGRSRCGLPSPGARRPVAQGSPRSFRQDGSTELIGYRRPRPHQPLVSAPCSSQGPRSGAIR